MFANLACLKLVFGERKNKTKKVNSFFLRVLILRFCSKHGYRENKSHMKKTQFTVYKNNNNRKLSLRTCHYTLIVLAGGQPQYQTIVSIDQLETILCLKRSPLGSFPVCIHCFVMVNSCRYKVPVLKQFQAVLWRCWLVNVREPMLMKARIVQTIVSTTFSFFF